MPRQVADGYGHRFERILIGRRKQPRLDVTLANCSITEINARAYVLGLFQGVTPGGAALVVDNRLDGAIQDFALRRMFSANVGNVFVMPAARSTLRAELVLFAGLGLFDQLDRSLRGDGVQELAAEHVVRACARTRVEEFATVLLGAGSGKPAAASVRNMLTGFLRGLRDADPAGHFRSITFCEIDRARYHDMKKEVYRLCSTSGFGDFEVMLSEFQPGPAPATTDAALPPPPARHARRERPVSVTRTAEPVYLIVRQLEKKQKNGARITLSVLAPGGGTAKIPDVAPEVQDVGRARQLSTALDSMRGGATFRNVATLGDAIASQVLPKGVRRTLERELARPGGSHIVVVHDDMASRIPWEALRLDKWTPATGAGVSRRLTEETRGIAKWRQERKHLTGLDVLLVYNPGEGQPGLDLPAAKLEGERLVRLFQQQEGVRIRALKGREATHQAIVTELKSGAFDVFHYAGHAQFLENEPARSGLLCADGMLTASNLSPLAELPVLVVCNACESARVRGRVSARLGLAEGLLRGGIANFIGTYWPVSDAAAELFAGIFYRALLAGETIGAALARSRRELLESRMADWADYIHYGNHAFTLRENQQVDDGS